MAHRFVATAPKGLEQVLATELGGGEVRNQCVVFDGELDKGYWACLWSRVANRILLPIATVPAGSDDELYENATALKWSDHFGPLKTFAVHFISAGSTITHSHFGALRVKDAVVDSFRSKTGQRPNVSKDNPDLRIHVYAQKEVATLSVDLSGESLHRRGWRKSQGPAPIKENVAAAILLMTGWPQQEGLVDPMCGVGTFPIEAAMLSAKMAPGLLRGRWGFEGWNGHDPKIWERLKEEAREIFDPNLEMRIWGFDRDPGAIAAARKNLASTRLQEAVKFERGDILTQRNPAGPRGVVVLNPPYGERMGEDEDLPLLYRRLGRVFKERYGGWTVHLLTGSKELAKNVGLKADKRIPIRNGPLDCRLLVYPIEGKRGGGTPALPFANRLRKRHGHLKKWARREGVTAYRIYERDLPEYALVVDLYGDKVHVQEYAPPKSVDPVVRTKHLDDALLAIEEVLHPAATILKQRRRQKGGAQYETMDRLQEEFTVQEGPFRFRINLEDHLDTGLFLEMREVRKLLATGLNGKRFLNLFGYTGTASVCAAAAGAVCTTVDLSNTYLGWAKRNFEENNIRVGPHRFLRADVMQWLQSAQGRFDFILVAPPTYSRSRGMEGDFDLQRDHAGLIRKACELLSDDGTLLFATHYGRFKLDTGVELTDVTRRFVPSDFERVAGRFFFGQRGKEC